MPATDLDVVTGAFSYTGRAIATELLVRGRRVRTLSRRPPSRGDRLAGKVEVEPLWFDDGLARRLEGAETLYVTYWVRYDHGQTTFAHAVENTRHLLAAARTAGVRRVVHLSVANADATTRYPYFRGKTETERLVRESGLSHAIVRPTLTFGDGDILLNNIAWALRRLPVFLLPDGGAYDVQPVSVGDVARLAVDLGPAPEDVTVDAAGPEQLSYRALVERIHRAVGGRARLVDAPLDASLAVARLAGLLLRDVVVTRDELESLRDGLLVSAEPPRSADRLDDWLALSGATLGRRYASELGRNFQDHV